MNKYLTKLKHGALTLTALALIGLGCSAAMAQDMGDDSAATALAEHYEMLSQAKPCNIIITNFSDLGLDIAYELELPNENMTDTVEKLYIDLNPGVNGYEIQMSESTQDGRIDFYEHILPSDETQGESRTVSIRRGSGYRSLNSPDDIVLTDDIAQDVLSKADKLYLKLIESDVFKAGFLEQCDATYQNPLAGLGF